MVLKRRVFALNETRRQIDKIHHRPWANLRLNIIKEEENFFKKNGAQFQANLIYL